MPEFHYHGNEITEFERFTDFPGPKLMLEYNQQQIQIVLWILKITNQTMEMRESLNGAHHSKYPFPVKFQARESRNGRHMNNGNKRRSHHSPDEGLDGHEELLDAGVPHHLRDHTAGRGRIEPATTDGVESERRRPRIGAKSKPGDSRNRDRGRGKG
jgi:hypothetical protein